VEDAKERLAVLQSSDSVTQKIRKKLKKGLSFSHRVEPFPSATAPKGKGACPLFIFSPWPVRGTGPTPYKKVEIATLFSKARNDVWQDEIAVLLRSSH